MIFTTKEANQRPYPLRKSLLAIAVTAALLSGCGSSSGDDKDPVSIASLAGTAAKGIVGNGIVTAYVLNSDGTEGEIVGSAITDTNGSYSLPTDPSYDGVSPLLIKLTAGDDTTMTCDSFNDCGTTEHGDLISLAGTDFLLTSIVPGTGSNNVTAAITPFTNMAASNVIDNASASEVSDASILEATSKVNQIVGVNILETTPVNVASEADLSAASVDSQRYSIMLAALAAQAFDGTESVDDMLGNLNSFSDDFEDGSIGNDDGGLSLIDLYQDASDAAEAAEDSLSSDATAAVATLGEAIVGQLGDDEVFEPEATSSENLTEVAQAKALVTEVRTWVSSLRELENPAETFLDEADTLSETLSSHSEDVLEFYAEALGSSIEAITEALGADEGVPTSIESFEDGILVRTINITDNSTADTTEYVISATDFLGNSKTLDTTIFLNESLDTESIAAGDLTFSINGSASDDLVSISLANAALTVGLAEDQELGEDASGPVVSHMSIGAELTVKALDGGAETGEMIAASAEISLVALDDSSDDGNEMALEKIALNNLSITNDSGETAGLSASLVVNNATAFNADLEESDDNFADATINLSGNITVNGGASEAVLSISLNRTELYVGDMTATLGYDGKSLQMTADVVGEEANDGQDTADLALSFSNADGVTLTLETSLTEDDSSSGTVTVGESVVGTVDEDAIIRYNDGTFESL